MSNCPQINNTTVIGTSGISYDSTPLPCSDVKQCDGLNSILAKFDDIICNITNDVNILVEEVTNITEDLMIISEDIININTQLNICCPTTTTTSSSSSTSTTTSSTSSTTTTTTTEPPIDKICFCLFLEGVGCESQYSFLLSGNGPLFNGRPTYNFLPFLGYPAQVYYNGSNWVFYSSDLDLTQPLINSNYYPVGDYLDWGTVTVTGLMNSSSLGPCSEITTTTTSSSSSTTTTTTTTSCGCFQVFANNGDTVYYTDCNGDTYEEIFEGTPSTIPPLIGPNSKLYCVQSVTVVEPYFIRDLGLCVPGSYCNPTTTTTSSSTSTSTSTSSTSTSTSTSSTSTTTSTTTTVLECIQFSADADGTPGNVYFTDCNGSPQTIFITTTDVFCAISGTVSSDSPIISIIGICPA